MHFLSVSSIEAKFTEQLTVFNFLILLSLCPQHSTLLSSTSFGDQSIDRGRVVSPHQAPDLRAGHKFSTLQILQIILRPPNNICRPNGLVATDLPQTWPVHLFEGRVLTPSSRLHSRRPYPNGIGHRQLLHNAPAPQEMIPTTAKVHTRANKQLFSNTFKAFSSSTKDTAASYSYCRNLHLDELF